MRSGVRDQPGQHGETPSLLKIQKISQAWWWVSVILATQEAEAGELVEPRRQTLQWAEIMPLHSNLGDRARHHLQKEKKERKEKKLGGGACLKSRLLRRLRWEHRLSPGVQGCCKTWSGHWIPAWVTDLKNKKRSRESFGSQIVKFQGKITGKKYAGTDVVEKPY